MDAHLPLKDFLLENTTWRRYGQPVGEKAQIKTYFHTKSQRSRRKKKILPILSKHLLLLLPATPEFNVNRHGRAKFAKKKRTG